MNFLKVRLVLVVALLIPFSLAKASEIKLMDFNPIGRDTFFSIDAVAGVDEYDAEGVKIRCGLGTGKNLTLYEAWGSVKSKAKLNNGMFKYKFEFYITKDQQVVLGTPEYNYERFVLILKSNSSFECKIFKPRYFLPQKNIGVFSFSTKEILPK